MSRLHVHIAANDFAAALRFYTDLFGCAADVVRDDYASWRLADPAANIALSAHGATPGINHLGIHADSPAELQRLMGGQRAPAACCGEGSSDYWLVDGQGVRWERTLDPFIAGVFSQPAPPGQPCCVAIAGAEGGASTQCCVPGDAPRAAQAADAGHGCC